jgi:para-nitrobenzyl esterase
MQARYGDLADDFFKLYPNVTQVQSGISQKAALRDVGLVSMQMWAALREKSAKNKSYTYYWTHAEPGPDSARFGAFHTSEVPYVFNTLNQSDRPWTTEDHKLADLLGSYWVNFMKTGDPNGRDAGGTPLPTWPAFTSRSAVTMELGAKTGVRPVADAATMGFWERYLIRPNSVAR